MFHDSVNWLAQIYSLCFKIFCDMESVSRVLFLFNVNFDSGFEIKINLIFIVLYVSPFCFQNNNVKSIFAIWLAKFNEMLAEVL